MELFEILEKTSCKVGLKGKTKEDVLDNLATLAMKSTKLKDFTKEQVYQLLKDREDQGSTGFGGEMAIPHARVEGMEDFLVFVAVSQKGLEFDSLDKKRVKLFFVILGPPEKVNEHLKILAGISRSFGTPGPKNEIIKARSELSLVETFVRHTRPNADEHREKQKMKLLVVNLYIDEYFYTVLEFFIESGIEGATILDSSGMGEYISNIPLFADFIGFMNKERNRSRTILAMVPEDSVDDIIAGIEEITGDMDKKQGAFVMVLDIAFFKGSMKMM